MMEQLPALQVVLPLIAAPLVVLLRRPNIAWFVAVAASWASLAIALLLFDHVGQHGVISYAMGSWPAPWGIEYRVDRLNAFVLVLVAGLAAIVAPYSLRSSAAEVPAEQLYLYYALYLLCLAGLLGIVITGDAFNLFVFMEISSLSMYVLIALGRSRRAQLAAYQYLIMGTLGATFYVIGVGMLYLMTGTLNIADLAQRVPEIAGTRAVYAALAFVTAGISLKLALFPLHFWLPNAYAYAPSAMAAFIAATATKVSVYVLLRYFFFVFGDAVRAGGPELSGILMALAAVGLVAASLVACYQGDLKRMFAFSSVAQIGYIILGISFANREGLTAAVAHLFNHGITKGALFLLLGMVALRAGGTDFRAVNGLARRMPLTSMGIVLAGFSLIGVPGTAGFITKWYLVLGALALESMALVALIVGSSLIAVVYVWRFVEAAYLREPAADAPGSEAPLSMLIPAWLLVAACIWFGFDTSFNVGAADVAARLMLRQP
ncbi:MAG TPA: monovalent cation/H+ antiporter subunit D family protein [Burkholderiales bacterium]|nr:monovalent cation/H+ antiporter subunit D family protein [Burkholderiales bacterium]